MRTLLSAIAIALSLAGPVAAQPSPEQLAQGQLAGLMMGKTVVFTVNYSLPGASAPAVQRQFYGVVRGYSTQRGFRVDLKGSRDGDIWWIPAGMKNLKAAEPGVYRLRGTKDVVTDPDFVSDWFVSAPISEPL